MTMILKISFEGGETKRITKGKVTELYDELTNYMINGFNYYEFTGNNGEKTIINLKKITDVQLEHNDNLKYGELIVQTEDGDLYTVQGIEAKEAYDQLYDAVTTGGVKVMLFENDGNVTTIMLDKITKFFYVKGNKE